MGLLLWGDGAGRRRAGHELDPRAVVSPGKKIWRERPFGIFLWNFWDEAITYVVTPTVGPKTLEYVFPPESDNAVARKEFLF